MNKDHNRMGVFRRCLIGAGVVLFTAGTAWGFEAAGTIKSVDADRRQLHINANGRDRVVSVANEAQNLWADGIVPRKIDGLVWERNDLAGDGTHPSDSGRQKVADLLLKFFTEDPLASTSFVKKPD